MGMHISYIISRFCTKNNSFAPVIRHSVYPEKRRNIIQPELCILPYKTKVGITESDNHMIKTSCHGSIHAKNGGLNTRIVGHKVISGKEKTGIVFYSNTGSIISAIICYIFYKYLIYGFGYREYIVFLLTVITGRPANLFDKVYDIFPSYTYREFFMIFYYSLTGFHKCLYKLFFIFSSGIKH